VTLNWTAGYARALTVKRHDFNGQSEWKRTGWSASR